MHMHTHNYTYTCICTHVHTHTHTHTHTHHNCVAPADYDATHVDLTFGPADTRQCATVIIIDNNFGELTENFFATLTTSDSAVTLGTDMARVDILVDPNDGEKLSSYSIMQSSYCYCTVVLEYICYNTCISTT